MKASQRVLAADIGSRAIKLAEFEANGASALTLLRYAVKEIPFSTHSNRFPLLADALKSAAAEMEIGAAFVALGVSEVFIRAVKLPPMPRNRLEKIVDFEARQNAPFSLEEAVWDYQLFFQGAETRALIAAAQKNFIEEICAACACVPWKVQFVDASPLALARALEADEQRVIMDMGAAATRLIFLGKNKIFYRSIPLGGQLISENIAKELNVDFEEAEAWKKNRVSLAVEDSGRSKEARAAQAARMVFARLYLEINRAIDFYQAQCEGAFPSALLLAGGASLLPHADVFLSEKLSLPVARFNLAQSVPFSPQLDSSLAERNAPLLAPLVGLARRASQRRDEGINLLPHSVRAEKGRLGRRLCLAGALAAWTLAFVIPALAGCWQWRQVARLAAQEKIRLAEMTLFFQQTQNSEKELQKNEAFLRAYDQLVQARAFWPALLDDLNERVFPDVWLTFLDAEDNSRLNLRGLAEASGDALRKIGDFRAKLASSPFFKEVKNVRAELPSASAATVALSFTFQASLKEERQALP
ncbi:MAG: pilus assembly protein PilM [bacterium]